MGARRNDTQPRAFRRRRFTPSAAGMAALAAAQAALYGEGDAITGDDALALREQLRVEADTRARRQGELRLVSKGRG